MAITTSIYDAALNTLALIKTYLGGDSKEDFEPIHSTTYDISADERNVAVSGVAEITMRTRNGSMPCFQFGHANVPASQTDLDLYMNGDAQSLYATAPWDGSVVGISIAVENARSAGTMTVNWNIAGVNQTLTFDINGTNDQFFYAVQAVGDETFSAGDALGMHVTTDGTWAAGATPSVSAALLCCFGE